MRKKTVIITASVLIAGGVVVVGYNSLSKDEVVKQEHTIVASKGDIQVNITANGVVEATTVDNIVPSASGKIKENFLEDGKTVKKGDLLVTFEGEDFGQDLAQQEASLEKQKIDLKTLEKSLEKNNENLAVFSSYTGTVKDVLVSTGDSVQTGQAVAVIEKEGEVKEVKSKASGEVSVINVNAGDMITSGDNVVQLNSNKDLENQIEKQKLDIKGTEKSIEDLKEKQEVPNSIYAPFDGEVTVAEETAVGSTININSVLGTITNYSEFKLALAIDELDIPKVKIGQKVEITAGAYPGEKFEGEVIKIASQGKTTNGVSTFDVEVSIKDPKELKAGMTANAKIVVSKQQNTLLVPVEAVKTKNGKKVVTVQVDKGTKDVQVITGLNNENYIEIASGIKEGEDVVLPVTSAQTVNPIFGGNDEKTKALGSSKGTQGGN
ncbi:efflux RND transporter periplasmic adaptor subunit [Priestia megaterium]|uniref:Efflux RND transporter periplasmic adaptor subunit n=1 Tax=Priestia megaterium TaxID=1404 RepID=A0A6M6E2B1_PRIMG|nr:efflux RND transporter periplasmic adaptor subunit [Priestia megaterium]QJX79896.1 efflux RND transporter periplasmic adaptor subunit [Priestia megaterium]